MTACGNETPGVLTLGKALIAPDQHPHYYEIRVAKDQEVMRKEWADIDDDVEAFCAFDVDSVDSGSDCLGTIVFRQDKFNRSNIVHECTHGAICFVIHCCMHSGAVSEMPEQEQQEYFEEAVPRVTASLFEQVEAMLPF